MAAQSPVETQERFRPARWHALMSGALDSLGARIGIGLLAVFIFVVAVGPTLAPYSPTEIGVGLPNASPSADHLFGTDTLGRDVLSRLLCGARSVIAVPLFATMFAFAIGGLAGSLSGYVGGAWDAVASRVIDVLLSLPGLLIVLVVIAAFGSSDLVLLGSVAIVYCPRVARVLRGATQNVATREYVQAAQARGERALSVTVREILPNIAPTVFVEFALRLTWIIIFITTLNFLGLGVAPPSPNWGLMVSEARPTILVNPSAVLAPTLAIGALCVAIGLIADAVTERLGVRTEVAFLR